MFCSFAPQNSFTVQFSNVRKKQWSIKSVGSYTPSNITLQYINITISSSKMVFYCLFVSHPYNNRHEGCMFDQLELSHYNHCLHCERTSRVHCTIPPAGLIRQFTVNLIAYTEISHYNQTGCGVVLLACGADEVLKHTHCILNQLSGQLKSLQCTHYKKPRIMKSQRL